MNQGPYSATSDRETQNDGAYDDPPHDAVCFASRRFVFSPELYTREAYKDGCQGYVYQERWVCI